MSIKDQGDDGDGAGIGGEEPKHRSIGGCGDPGRVVTGRGADARLEWLEEWEGVKRRQLDQWGWEGKEGAGSSWRGMWRGREGLLKERELTVLMLTGSAC